MALQVDHQRARTRSSFVQLSLSHLLVFPIPRDSHRAASVRAFPQYNDAAATFPVPANTSAVLIYGAIMPDAFQYAVLPASLAPDLISQPIQPVQYAFATPFWVGDHVLLYVGQWTLGYEGNISVIMTSVSMGSIGIDRAVFLHLA